MYEEEPAVFVTKELPTSVAQELKGSETFISKTSDNFHIETPYMSSMFSSNQKRQKQKKAVNMASSHLMSADRLRVRGLWKKAAARALISQSEDNRQYVVLEPRVAKDREGILFKLLERSLF